MPYKNIIFDLGAVLIEWNPEAIVDSFTQCPEERKRLLQDVLGHADWQEMDRGMLTDDQAAERFCERVGMNRERMLAFLLLTKTSLLPIERSVRLLKSFEFAGYRLFCLTNMSTECFDFISRYDFFQIFEGIVVSGKEKMIKPDKRLFELLLDRYDLRAEETFFLDDRKENIEGAGDVGIAGQIFDASNVCYAKIYDFLGSAEKA